MRFWMRLLSSGSVTSFQSSVLCFDLGEALDECLLVDDRDDMLELSCSASDPDWVPVLPRRLLDGFFDGCDMESRMYCGGEVDPSRRSTDSVE